MKPRIAGAVLIALCAAVAAPTPASAAQRTFVASGGINSNPCTRVAPCRDFATALTATDADGEIIVLDSAGYGGLTIDKGVSIIAPPGVYAGVTVFTGDGITVNAPGARVRLIGLTLNGLGTTGSGVNLVAAGELVVSGCRLSNFFPGINQAGILGTNAASSRLIVDDSVLEHNDYGIRLLGTAAVEATVARSRGIANSFGMFADFGSGASHVVVTEAIIDGTGSPGGSACCGLQTQNALGTLVIDRVEIAHAGALGAVYVTSTAVIGRSGIYGSGTGLNNAGGTIASYGDNQIAVTGSPTAGAITPLTRY